MRSDVLLLLSCLELNNVSFIAGLEDFLRLFIDSEIILPHIWPKCIEHLHLDSPFFFLSQIGFAQGRGSRGTLGHV